MPKRTYEKVNTRHVHCISAGGNDKARGFCCDTFVIFETNYLSLSLPPITVVVAIDAAGGILPMQSIFAGLTEKCFPKEGTPGRVAADQLGFHITCSENHWSNMATMMDWVNKILIPDVQRKRAVLGKPDQWALLALDLWAVHKNASFLNHLRENKIRVVFIPGGLTGEISSSFFFTFR